MKNNMIKKPFKDFFKDYLTSNIKEWIRFAIVGTIVFLLMTIFLAYLFVRILELNNFVSTILIIIIVSLTIIYIDEKRIHAHKKILKNNIELVRRLLHKEISNEK